MLPMSYDFLSIEKKWAAYWVENATYKCDTHDFSKPKYYILDMFPYPSAQGLHVGHPEGYTATDIIARMKRMQGFNVLHPMGWDAFGLPAEQFAIKNNVHPEIITRKNIDNFRKQIQALGFSYDWSKELATVDPSYYKWTQWIFLQLFKNDLAYCADIPVNYCPELGTVLANEEVIDGKSERGGYPVIRMPMRQWMLKITAYADRLDKDLVDLDWPKSTLEMQKNWIGRSEGVAITFKIAGTDETFEVFTTRVDTLFGCTYCCLAPEHPLVEKLASPEQKEAVLAYVKASASKSDLTRGAAQEKTGVYLGVEAINPINGTKIPVYVADYVLGSYGSGAVMAVPAHDERDYAFAKKHDLPIIQVLEGDISENAFTGDAKHIASDFANGLNIAEAKAAITKKLVEQGDGKRVVNYKLRDWVFSRQRYWGEPIPVLEKEDGTFLPVDESQLPIVLPQMDEFKPGKAGRPPLEEAPSSWLYVTLPNGEKAKRETNTMPQWAGSCWYYIRYIDPQNDNVLCDEKLLKHWLPVDLYVGGSEHAVLHLLYARFWHKFLYDIGVVNTPEPFTKLYHQGMILGENGEKMSKSRGNVVNPDDIVVSHGADSLRLFEMFAGPLNEVKPWSTNGLDGAKRFIERVYRFVDEPSLNEKLVAENDGKLDYAYNFLVKKVSNDFVSLDFNTAISAMMVFINECYKAEKIYRPYFEGFVKMFSCICPFVGEEMWQRLGHDELLVYQSWPTYDESKLVLATIKLTVSVNGKMRDVLEVGKDAEEEEVKALAFASEKVKPFVEGKDIKKIIYVKGRILNIVAA